MIELKDVSAGYGGRTVIDDISLKILEGRLISIIGANGCGKSTLLKSIIGIVPIKSGTVTVGNIALTELSRQDIAKKTAYLAQGKSVPDMTVEQMVLHGRFPHLGYPRRYSKKDREIANNALKKVGIEALSDRQLSSLSGGMRQNAYIAMALAQDTDYILLDEPTTYLDVSHQVELMKILRSLADSGKGIAAVMHDLPLAFGFSDSIAVIRDGKIILCDTPEKVYKTNIVKDVFGIELQYAAHDNAYYYKYPTY